MVGVNEATKYFQFIDDTFKTYRATLKLGTATDTLDKTGQITEQKDVPNLALPDLQSAASQFVGQHDQEPPMYSAVKVGGKKLYQLARQGLEVDRQSRKIEISQFKIIEWSDHQIYFNVTVSRGTYIRVLADEYARVLGTVGHLVELTRTKLCGHDLNDAVDLETSDEIGSKKIPIEKMLLNLNQVELNKEQERNIFFGKKIPITDFTNNTSIETAPEGVFFTARHASQFLGVIQKKGPFLVPTRLMEQRAEL